MNVLDVTMVLFGWRELLFFFCSFLGTDPATGTGDSYWRSSPGPLRSCQLPHRPWIHHPLLGDGCLLLPKWVLRPQD